MSTVLSFEQVGYWYQTRKDDTHYILKDMTIDFEQGQFYSVVGPSGSGKTTFLSLASALDVPKEGKILFKGKDIKKIGLTNFRNKHVSIVFQSYNLLPYMTALQNVMTAMEITGSKQKNKKEYALKMLQKVGISPEKAKQKVLTLSGGQQQRVSIARALSCESPLIVADEPTGNLDEQTAHDIIQLFEELAHTENKCVIVVTHDSKVADASDITIRLANKHFQYA